MGGFDVSARPILAAHFFLLQKVSRLISLNLMKAILALEDGSVFHGTVLARARRRAAKFASTRR